MSEVDRLSNSGLYPALPIADRRSSKDDKERRQRSDEGPDKPPPKSPDAHDTSNPRPPKSLIDEYA
ncbi:MAG: hypothetical protein QOF42_232 [Gammaproteobacteria bacterium]|jgi:hypothetical protein|nr:hypothetical protein [Gammaproteobacteria bacterium]